MSKRADETPEEFSAREKIRIREYRRERAPKVLDSFVREGWSYEKLADSDQVCVCGLDYFEVPIDHECAYHYTS